MKTMKITLLFIIIVFILVGCSCKIREQEFYQEEIVLNQEDDVNDNYDELNIEDNSDLIYQNNEETQIPMNNTYATIKPNENEVKHIKPIKVLYVNVAALNVRNGMGTDYEKIGSLKYGEEVKIINDDGVWCQIVYDKIDAYVKKEYLSENKVTIDKETENCEHLIIINSKKNTLNYYYNGVLTKEYKCATGKKSTPTPQGKFSIYNKIVNRPYYKENIPGGDPRNPLGKRWMGLQVNETNGTTYGIHGTNDESSIGKSVSHGCIRMHNKDVESFYEIVPIGTTVIIKKTNDSDKDIAKEYKIYLK